jgi:hypothetical protein
MLDLRCVKERGEPLIETVEGGSRLAPVGERYAILIVDTQMGVDLKSAVSNI